MEEENGDSREKARCTVSPYARSVGLQKTWKCYSYFSGMLVIEMAAKKYKKGALSVCNCYSYSFFQGHEPVPSGMAVKPAQVVARGKDLLGIILYLQFNCP